MYGTSFHFLVIFIIFLYQKIKKKLALKSSLQPTGYNGGIVGLDRLEGDMRNMNSADKVDDDACHKEKCAENNVSHDISWDMWCLFRLQFRV